MRVPCDRLKQHLTANSKEGMLAVFKTHLAATTASVQCVLPSHACRNVNSDYLWSIDPLDGTCNFSAGAFCVVGERKGKGSVCA